MPSGSRGNTVIRGGAGLMVGPGQMEDQIQPIESDRVSSTVTGGAFPTRLRLRGELHEQPE